MKIKDNVKRITFTALFMSMNIALSSFGVPVPGGHLYLNDIIICIAGILLDPLSAFIVGGVGAFLGDMIFYPAPMFVSLATHGLQAAAISIIANKLSPKHELFGNIIAVSVGVVIMVTGYTLGAAYVYSTPAYAIMKLPFEFLQAGTGAVCSVIFCYKVKLKEKLAHSVG